MTQLLTKLSLRMRHPTMLKSYSRLAESRRCLREILRPWESLNQVHLLSRTKQTQKCTAKHFKQYITRSTLCRVTVNILNSVSDPALPESAVAAMIAQFYKTAASELKKACIQTLQSHLFPLCEGPHGHGNLWIAVALYRVPSPRGGFWGLSPPNTAPSPPN